MLDLWEFDGAYYDLTMYVVSDPGTGQPSTQAIRGGRYLALDAAETLSRFTINGMPDPALFQEVVGGLVRRASEAGAPLRAFGENPARVPDRWRQFRADRLTALLTALRTAVNAARPAAAVSVASVAFSAPF